MKGHDWFRFDEQHTDGKLFKNSICHKTENLLFCKSEHINNQYCFWSVFIHDRRVKIWSEKGRLLWPDVWPAGYARNARRYLSSLIHVVAVTVTPANFLFQRRHPTLIGNNARKQIPLTRLPSQKNAWDSGAGARRVIYHCLPDSPENLHVLDLIW